MNDEVILRIDNLRAGYSLGRRFVDAVSDVSLELNYGEIFGLAGESGCGKSTLLKIIYGYTEPPLTRLRGSLTLKTKEGMLNLHELNMDELRKKVWWKYVTWVPQGAMSILNPTLRIRDHFIEMFKLHSNFKIHKKEAYNRIVEHLKNLGLSKEVADTYPTQLSGGMKQRVVIALALLFNPLLVLADEPTSALDVVNQKVILEQLLMLQKEHGFTLILVSHDINVHGVLTDRMGIMYAGKIVEIGYTEKVFADPLHPYTKALIESLPRIGDKVVRKGLYGSPPNLSTPPSGCRFHPRCPYAMDICKREEPPMIEIENKRRTQCWLYNMS
ncbi:MAG: ABC transporter ATP-binding protein [Candidatus Bathyarchaeia archaeon]